MRGQPQWNHKRSQPEYTCISFDAPHSSMIRMGYIDRCKLHTKYTAGNIIKLSSSRWHEPTTLLLAEKTGLNTSAQQQHIQDNKHLSTSMSAPRNSLNFSSRHSICIFLCFGVVYTVFFWVIKNRRGLRIQPIRRYRSHALHALLQS